MRMFLDTANLDELRKGAAWGIVDGVTTNPTLIAKEGRPIEEQVAKICEIVDGDVSAEVVALESAKMIAEGLKLAKIHKNIVVKVPLTRDGIVACKALSGEGAWKEAAVFDRKLVDGLRSSLSDDAPVFYEQGKPVIKEGQTGILMFVVLEEQPKSPASTSTRIAPATSLLFITPLHLPQTRTRSSCAHGCFGPWSIGRGSGGAK